MSYSQNNSPLKPKILVISKDGEPIPEIVGKFGKRAVFMRAQEDIAKTWHKYAFKTAEGKKANLPW